MDDTIPIHKFSGERYSVPGIFNKVDSIFISLIIEWVQSLREIQLFLTLYGVSVVICDTLCDSLQG